MKSEETCKVEGWLFSWQFAASPNLSACCGPHDWVQHSPFQTAGKSATGVQANPSNTRNSAVFLLLQTKQASLQAHGAGICYNKSPRAQHHCAAAQHCPKPGPFYHRRNFAELCKENREGLKSKPRRLELPERLPVLPASLLACISWLLATSGAQMFTHLDWPGKSNILDK